jgi:hypothetical protein
MDDVGIGSGKYDEGLTDDNDDSFDQHIVLLEVVLVRSQEANLTFSMRKAFFAQWVVTQLGHEVGWGYIAPDPARTTQIAGWPRPQSREDVEYFLACMNFMRTMMCPSLAEKSAPLRVAVKELQRARSQGYKTKCRAKGTAPTLAPDESPEFWTEEMEESFNTLRRMALQAIRLQVPDFQGAMDGTNPFIVNADACKFAVGGAILQRRGVTAGDLSMTYYGLIGVDTSATQLQVQRAIAAARRRANLRMGEAAEVLMKTLQEVEDNLVDKFRRLEYDQQMGLNEKRRDRQELVVLAMWSRSLSESEQKWTVWEKEIRAQRDLNRTFAPMLQGAYKSLHTDHLNNLVLGSALGNSDRVTRDLNEIEGSGVCTWYFMAGKTNVMGDVINRNPLDRDAVRDELEAREGKPITLREAMRMVMSARGVPEEDLDVMLAAPKDEKDPEVVKFMTELEEGHCEAMRRMSS